MNTIHIQVAGPGTCFSNQLHIIEQALISAGYPVQVVNEFPATDKTVRPAMNGWDIIITAIHRNWGEDDMGHPYLLAVIRAISAIIWVIGITLAKGFWLTVLAVFLPLYSWCLVAQHIITKYNLL